MATEIIQLFDEEIPEGRQQLQDNFGNLEKVAEYCENNYLQAVDKKKALEETRNFTTHSLASVAYQINSLATNFLKLLDLQQNQMAEMESSVNHLAQVVQIHKEKVARREIGVLTTNRSAYRPPGVRNGIIFPEQGEKPIKYTRKTIDYSLLDDIGHGVKLPTPQTSQNRPQRTNSVSSSGSGSAPTTRPPTPPNASRGNISGGGTLGRSAGINYRTAAPPVAPPSVPGHYGPGNYQPNQLPMQPPGAMRQGPGYMSSQAVMMGQVHLPPNVGMARPMSQMSPGPMSPPAMMQHAPRYPGGRPSIDSLPPPPPDDGDDNLQLDVEVSQSLPPPPDQTQQGMPSHPHAEHIQHTPPPPADFSDRPREHMEVEDDEDPYAATGPDFAEPAWVPKVYIEKVIALYDYQAQREDELSFSENSTIYVVKKNEDDWWEGMMDNMVGLFPSNYVEPCM